MKAPGILSRYKAASTRYGTGLKKIWDRIWKVLTFNLIEGVVFPKKCLSLSIEKGAVSAAYGTLFLSRPCIRGSRRYPFDEDKYAGPENLSWAASRALDELKASGSAIVLTVPREFLVLRTVELPSSTKENISSVISYELDRLTPFTSSEATYDFKVYDEEEGKLKLIIAAIRTDVLRPYLDVLKEKKMRPARIAVSSTSLGTLCGAFDNRDNLFCISIHGSGYEGCLMKKGAVASTFSGTFTASDRETNLNQIAGEITPFLGQLKDKGISPAIILCPVDGYTTLQQKTGLPVRILKNDEIQRRFKTTNRNIVLAPLGGLLEAILPKAKGFNLMSKGVAEARKVPIAVTIALLCIIVAMIIPYLVVPLELQKSRLRQIDAHLSSRKGEIKKIEALKKEISDLSTEIDRIKNFKESSPMALNIMKELTTVLPSTVWLTRTRITGETVEIEGYAAAATEILPKLEQSKMFRKAEFTSPTIRDVRMNADRFVMKMELEGIVKKESGEDKNEKEE